MIANNEQSSQSGRIADSPSNKVFAVVNDAAQAESAMERLKAAGVSSSDAAILSDASAAEALRPSSALQQLSDISTYLERYADSVREGKTVLVVSFDDDEQRKSITSLLLASDASDVAYTTGWTVTGVVE